MPMNNLLRDAYSLAVPAAAIVLAFVAYLAGRLSTEPEDAIRQKIRTELRADISLAVSNGEVTLDQLQDLAATHGAELSDVYEALQFCLREALTKRDTLLSLKLQAISKLLAEFRDQIFGTTIPDDTAILLNDVKRRLGEEAEALQPLVENIRRLVAENSRVAAREKKKSTWSLIFGALGVLLGLLLWRFPFLPGALPATPKPTDAVETSLQGDDTGVTSCGQGFCLLKYRLSGGELSFMKIPILKESGVKP